MLRSLRQKSKWIIIGGLALLIALINTGSLQYPSIAIACVAGFLLSCARLIGPRIAPHATTLIQISLGAGATISWLAIAGSIIYYVGPVHTWLLTTLCVITLLACGILHPNTISTHTPPTNSSLPISAFIGIIICVSAWIFAIAPVEITQSIRSVWLAIDPTTILVLSFAILLTIAAFRAFSKNLRFASLVLILTSVLFLPALAYPLGYGFDPFIHRTTIAHIIEFGTITPKPLYYIGQYALELIATLSFGTPLFGADILLVPILSIVLLTGTALHGFGQRAWAPLTLLLMPLSVFISTTPQALSYIFTACIIFLSLPRLLKSENMTPFWLLVLLSLAALITHPLAGIPACLYVALVWLTTDRTTKTATIIQSISFWLCAIAGSVVIPAVFFIQASLSDLAIKFSLRELAWDQLALSGFWRNQFSSIPDLLYLVIDNTLWIALIFGLIGAIVLIKQRAPKTAQLPLLMVLLLIVNYLVLTLTLEFDFLIEYERTNYALRLITLILLFLLPHTGFAIDGVFNALKQRPRSLRLGWTVLLTIMTTAGIYGAFPRHDNYARSAGFNVSTTDFDAAAAIHAKGMDEEYIVLSNQAVSAAALELYGFRQYFHGDIFYYPIPTGGELYELYLRMADEEPTREAMYEAMDLAGVDLGFFVLNNYWWDANRIRESAKQEADSWFGLGDGDDSVTVFIFTR